MKWSAFCKWDMRYSTSGLSDYNPSTNKDVDREVPLCPSRPWSRWRTHVGTRQSCLPLCYPYQKCHSTQRLSCCKVVSLWRIYTWMNHLALMQRHRRWTGSTSLLCLCKIKGIWPQLRSRLGSSHLESLSGLVACIASSWACKLLLETSALDQRRTYMRSVLHTFGYSCRTWT